MVFLKGKFNINWKEKIKYSGIHEWMRRNKSKVELCELCKLKISKELANISKTIVNNQGTYQRDINDFMWLCSSCHHKYDSILRNKICLECKTIEFRTISSKKLFCSSKCKEKNWKKNNLEKWKIINNRKIKKYKIKQKGDIYGYIFNKNE